MGSAISWNISRRKTWKFISLTHGISLPIGVSRRRRKLNGVETESHYALPPHVCTRVCTISQRSHPPLFDDTRVDTGSHPLALLPKLTTVFRNATRILERAYNIEWAWPLYGEGRGGRKNWNSDLSVLSRDIAGEEWKIVIRSWMEDIGENRGVNEDNMGG